jgi:HAD superfamily hydrolase (TIGR01490 family)
MEIQHLRAFCEVARELSFTRAARNLHCAQSTVTGQIKRLETDLGTVLFQRRGRCPIELTAAGELLQWRAELILRWVDATDRDVRRVGGEQAVLRADPGEPCRICFFDVDETLITGKSMSGFLELHLVGRPSAAEAQRQLADCSSAGAPREEVNRAYYRIFRGCSLADLARTGRVWFAAAVQDGLFHPPVLGELRRHQRLGHRVALISGSFPACLDPIAEALGVRLVLCTQPLTVGGICTGEVEVPVIGEQKAVAVRGAVDRYGARAEDCFAYGDDASDLQMLEAVGHPVVVGSDPVLRRSAAERDWPWLPGVEALQRAVG